MSTSDKKNTLGKLERLKSHKIIQELFNSGKIIHHHPFKVLYLPKSYPERLYPVQLAISVSKRNVKMAVHRNALKRKIREAYRLNKYFLYDKLEGNDQILYLFVIYTAKEKYDFQRIEKEMKILMKKITNKILKE